MGFFKKVFGPSEPDEVRLGHRHILIVEPSITVTKVVELTFADDPIKTTSSLAQARQAIATASYDVALVAADVADGDVYDFVREISPRCAVIVLRGAFLPLDEPRARAAGARAIIAKPFDPKALIGAVDEALRGRKPGT